MALRQCCRENNFTTKILTEYDFVPILDSSSSTMCRRSNEAVLLGGFSRFGLPIANMPHTLFEAFFGDEAV